MVVEGIDKMSELFLSHTDLRFDRYAAVDGHTLNHTFLYAYNITTLPAFGMLSFGEVACFLSHYYVWQQIAEQKESTYRALVLEDDVRFLPFFRRNLLAVIDYTHTHHVDPDMIYIGRQKVGQDSIIADQMQKVQDRLSAAEYKLVPTADSYGWGAHGYILSAAGARKLLAVQPLQKLIPVDHMLNLMGGFRYSRSPHEKLLNSSYTTRNLISFAADPVLITQLRNCLDCRSGRANKSDLREEKKAVGTPFVLERKSVVRKLGSSRGAVVTQRTRHNVSFILNYFSIRMNTNRNKNIISALPNTTLEQQICLFVCLFIILSFIHILRKIQRGRMCSAEHRGRLAPRY